MASYLTKGSASSLARDGRNIRNMAGSPSFPGLASPNSSGIIDNSCGMPTSFEMLSIKMDESFGTDLPLDEAVQRLQDLMRENQELKNTVRDNNVMMKSLQTVLLEMKSNWEHDQTENMKKFEQARSLVYRLRNDLETSKNNFDDLEKQLQQRSRSSSSLPSDTDVEALHYELEQCKTTLSRMKGEREIHKKETDNLVIKVEQAQKMTTEKNSEVEKLVGQLEEKAADCDKLEAQLSQLVQYNKKMAEGTQRLTVEKQDLVAMNNELQTQLHLYKSSIISAGSSMGPDSLAAGMKESFVMLGDETDKGPGGENKQTNESSENRQMGDLDLGDDVSRTHIKYPIGQSSEDDRDGKSAAEHMRETRGEKVSRKQELAMGNVLVQLLEEKSKVKELSEAVSQLTNAMEVKDHELQTAKLNTSADGQLHQLQLIHEQREAQLLQDIDMLQRQLHQSKDFQSHTGHDSNMKAQVMSLLNEVQETNRRYEMAQTSVQRYQQKCEALEQRCSAIQEELETQRSKDDHLIEALRGTVSDMETTLAAKKEELDKKGVVIEDLSRKVQTLQREVSVLKYQLEESSKKSSAHAAGGAVVLSVAEKRDIDEKIDNLTAQLLSAQDSLHSKQEENQKLQQKVMLLRNDSEDVQHLKAQIESYKNDFEAERQAGIRYRQDKDALKNDVESLHHTNQQLRDQLRVQFQNSIPVRRGQDVHSSWDRLRGRPYPGGGVDVCDTLEANLGQGRLEMSPDHTRQSNENTVAAPTTEPDICAYTCPKCQLRTQDIDSLLIHADECVTDPDV